MEGAGTSVEPPEEDEDEPPDDPPEDEEDTGGLLNANAAGTMASETVTAAILASFIWNLRF